MGKGGRHGLSDVGEGGVFEEGRELEGFGSPGGDFRVDNGG